MNPFPTFDPHSSLARPIVHLSAIGPDHPRRHVGRKRSERRHACGRGLELDRTDALLLDVREPDEIRKRSHPGWNQPAALAGLTPQQIQMMRARYAELPVTQECLWKPRNGTAQNASAGYARQYWASERLHSSTSSLVLGVAAAHATHSNILVAGIAGLVAGSMSMAAGEYVSVHSQADTQADSSCIWNFPYVPRAARCGWLFGTVV